MNTNTKAALGSVTDSFSDVPVRKSKSMPTDWLKKHWKMIAVGTVILMSLIALTAWHFKSREHFGLKVNLPKTCPIGYTKHNNSCYKCDPGDKLVNTRCYGRPYTQVGSAPYQGKCKTGQMMNGLCYPKCKDRDPVLKTTCYNTSYNAHSKSL